MTTCMLYIRGKFVKKERRLKKEDGGAQLKGKVMVELLCIAYVGALGLL